MCGLTRASLWPTPPRRTGSFRAAKRRVRCCSFLRSLAVSSPSPQDVYALNIDELIHTR